MKKNQRYLDSLASKLTLDIKEAKVNILNSSSDIGVRRNLGRNGSRFAPSAIMAQLLKLQAHSIKNLPIYQNEVSSHINEKNDFHQAQDEESLQIQNQLTNSCAKKIIHLGGGHDHAFPFLTALSKSLKKTQKLFILNIDAHCDTRSDNNRHSGTPFRDFDNTGPVNTQLIQFGIHPYANSESTLEQLTHIKMSCFNKEQFETVKEILKTQNKEDFIYISLDADAINAQQMEAVSAVNHDGLQLETIKEIIQLTREFSHTAFGIYEYNPLYDNLSTKGARAICSLIYEYIR